ncbi:MAG: GNAT family N-acetyltransferase [Chloroflexi bacterium]|nr:GNAT family N-acetyltransferase [Chloroflexota bacterium]
MTVDPISLAQYSELFESPSSAATHGAYGAPALLQTAFADARWEGSILRSRAAGGDVTISVLRTNVRLIKTSQMVSTLRRFGIDVDEWAGLTLIGGTPAGSGFVYDASSTQSSRRAALNQLLARVASDAANETDHLIAMWANDEMASAFTEVSATSVAVAVDVHSWMPVGGSEGLNSEARANLRRDARRFAAKRIGWRLVPAVDAVSNIGSMIVRTKARHGWPDAVRRIREEMETMSQAPGLQTFGVIVTRDATVVAGSLCWSWRGTVHVVELGFDELDIDSRDSYLAALIHGPLEGAREHGAARLDLGVMSSAPKMRRGAQTEPSYLLHT